jgi:hypothetical protein
MINIETINSANGEVNASAPAGYARRVRASVAFPDGLSADEVRRELALMLGSRDFPASERNRRVLQYLIEAAIEGRDGDMNAYLIATRVYGRPQNFNPIKDPIVRIEMSRLRRDLEVYYLKGGGGRALRISIPKGAYFPQVTRATPSRTMADGASASPFLIAVLRASLAAWSGAQEVAAAAWQDLLLADPSMVANLHDSVAREVGDEGVTQMIVEGALRAARQTS